MDECSRMFEIQILSLHRIAPISEGKLKTAQQKLSSFHHGVVGLSLHC
jgi:hypothetical protein